MSDILIQEKQTRTVTDHYTFLINRESGLIFSAGSMRHVILTFINGAIKDVQHDIEQPYLNTHDYWKLMGAIVEKIEQLTQELRNKMVE